jgi:cytochrome c peroxidase
MKQLQIMYLFFVCLLTACIIEQPNKLSNPQKTLGHYLFFETKLSINNTKSCASCHSTQFAFTDGYRTSVTPQGENVLHNAPSLMNSIYLKYYDWANPTATSFLAQIKRPLYNHQPIELGLDKHINELQLFFKHDSLYSHLFKQAFPTDDSLFTLQQIENSIVEYEKLLVSKESNFDKKELNKEAENGLALFSSKRLNCVTCHPPPHFTLATQTNNMDSVYANIGLYNVANKNEYPTSDNGIYYFTKNKKDDGKFKIPSLRNVMLTAPYMHDGSIANIGDVIDMYARGGRLYNNEDGKLNTNKNKLITGFTITEKEKNDVIHFLNSLTDSSIFYKQIFQNPHKKM